MLFITAYGVLRKSPCDAIKSFLYPGPGILNSGCVRRIHESKRSRNDVLAGMSDAPYVTSGNLKPTRRIVSGGPANGRHRLPVLPFHALELFWPRTKSNGRASQARRGS